jgi:hypothetical protein
VPPTVTDDRRAATFSSVWPRVACIAVGEAPVAGPHARPARARFRHEGRSGQNEGATVKTLRAANPPEHVRRRRSARGPRGDCATRASLHRLRNPTTHAAAVLTAPGR